MQVHKRFQMKKADIRTSLVPGAEGREKGVPGVYCLHMCHVPMGTYISLVPRPCVLVTCSTKFAQKTWFILSRDVCHRRNFMSHPVYSKYCRVAEISTNGVGKI